MKTKTLKTRLAWLAGIIDGEGCIHGAIVATRYVRKDGTQGSQLDIKVSVANTDLRIIDEVRAICEAIGIKTHTHCQPYITGRKSVWHIAVDAGRQIEILLNAVMPYLVAKKSRAETLLAIILRRRRTMYVKGRQGGLPLEGDAWFAAQLATLKSGNRRGVPEVADAPQ